MSVERKIVQIRRGSKLRSFHLLSLRQYAERFTGYRTDVGQTARINLTFQSVRSIEWILSSF